MEKMIIGEILKPQGIKGEVKIKPLIDTQFFKNIPFVYINNKKFDIEKCSVREEFVFVLFKDIYDRNIVENMRGDVLFVDKQSLSLNSDEFFVEDLIGCDVVTDDGVDYGKITMVNQYGAADIFTVAGKYGIWQFPYIDDVVDGVDIVNKLITVNKKRFDEVKV